MESGIIYFAAGRRRPPRMRKRIAHTWFKVSYTAWIIPRVYFVCFYFCFYFCFVIVVFVCLVFVVCLLFVVLFVFG